MTKVNVGTALANRTRGDGRTENEKTHVWNKLLHTTHMPRIERRQPHTQYILRYTFYTQNRKEQQIDRYLEAITARK